MPHRGVSCHLCDAVVPSFFKNLPQKVPPSGEELAHEVGALLESQIQREADAQTLLATWRSAYVSLLATWMYAHAMDRAERQAFLREEAQVLGEVVTAFFQSLTSQPHDET